MTDDGSSAGDGTDALEIDVDETDGSLYRILSSAVVPRPIAWVSTRSEDGVDNLAPYSFFTVASVDRKSTRLNSSHRRLSRMPSSA